MLLSASATVALCQNHTIDRFAIHGGPGLTSSGSHALTGTIQPSARTVLTSARFRLATGYWVVVPGMGACCVGSSCSVGTEGECLAMSGVYQGLGTSCSPNPCGPAICRGDASCDALVSFADINPFVRLLAGG